MNIPFYTVIGKNEFDTKILKIFDVYARKEIIVPIEEVSAIIEKNSLKR